MRIKVIGDLNNPLLLDTDKATAMLIETNDGKPNVIYKMMMDGNAWLRLTDGEDKNFNETAKQLGLT